MQGLPNQGSLAALLLGKQSFTAILTYSCPGACRIGGNSEVERRSQPELGFYPDPAPECFNDPFADVQTESAPGICSECKRVKRSNTRRRFSFAIPMPLSRTLITQSGPTRSAVM